VRCPPGFSQLELVVVLALLGIGATLGYPAAADRLAASRASAAAREMALTLHAARWRAVAGNTNVGLLFEQDPSGWHWFVVRDGNGNGLSTSEIRTGIDVTVSGPHRFSGAMSGVYPGFPPTPRIPRVPPRSGALSSTLDPVQFGRSDLISFSPFGTASSGTIYLTDGRHALRAVVLFGPTARVRVWRLDAREGRWRL